LPGCASIQLSRPLTTKQEAAIRCSTFPIVVGIDRHSSYSRELFTLLRATRVFHRVAYLDELYTDPDLIAIPERPYGRRAVATIPVLSIFSLGLIPTIVNEPREIGFRLISPEKPDEPLEVNWQEKSLTVLGWAAGVLNWLPNWKA